MYCSVALACHYSGREFTILEFKEVHILVRRVKSLNVTCTAILLSSWQY